MILLFSGGVDSFVAYHYLGKPQTVYFNLHTPYSEKEIKTVKYLIPDTIYEDCINFSSRQEGPKAYIPYRNLHLALLANKYSDEIVIAGLKDDMVDDKNEKIFLEWSYIMSKMMDRNIKVTSPFWNHTKEQVVHWYKNIYRGDMDALLNTVSCYSSGDIFYCGKCPSCFRKWCAFTNNDIYLDFYNINLMEEYVYRALQGEYIIERNESILKAYEIFKKGVRL